jgi:hypothetical protein
MQLSTEPHTVRGHQVRLPKPGGEWQRDAHRKGLRHRNGNPWNEVHPPRRRHQCRAQSMLVWTVNTKAGRLRAAIRWCACGGVTYPGAGGRWLGKNLRRAYFGAPLPAWHQAIADLYAEPARADSLARSSIYQPTTTSSHAMWPTEEPDAA